MEDTTRRIVDAVRDRQSQLEATLPDTVSSYMDIVSAVVKAAAAAGVELDPHRITDIDHGDYQGTLLFIVAASGYQPSQFWAVKIGYGSCSACDTLESILGTSSAGPWRGHSLYLLALDIAESFKEIA